MKKYHIEEGCVILPTEFVEDKSINILNLKELGTTLMISRSQFNSGETFLASFKRQITQLEKNMKNFKLTSQKEITIGKEKTITGIECRNEFETTQHFISQYQFACETADGMFVLSYAKHTELSKKQKKPSDDEYNIRSEEWEYIKDHYIVSDTFSE